MIFDDINNIDNYKDFDLLYQALSLIREKYKNDLPSSSIIVIKDRLICNPVTLTSKPENECKYEAHRRYIDLHYVISGIERIATANITTLDTLMPYSEECDIEFLNGNADGYYDIKPGQFMVCFPNDAHKVAIMVNEPTDIKKIVFKIEV